MATSFNNIEKEGRGPPESLTQQADFLERAAAAAAACGVTRLADITGLDRIGLPVWQAVRPAARALSVHQGKGVSVRAAKIGALCEAIESHCAEIAPGDGPRCSFAALAPEERAPEIADYADERHASPDAEDEVQWCAAADCLTDRPAFLPHPLVSLDYTSGLPSRFDRSSTGLGAGPDEASALHKSLLELIERDAVGCWMRASAAEKMQTGVILKTIPFDWFQDWHQRLEALGIDLRVFEIPSLIDVPVMRCSIAGSEEFGHAYRRFCGDAAGADAESALLGALAEAIQSRLTFIAGVRDDIQPSDYSNGGGPSPQKLPPVRSWRARVSEGGWREIAERLARHGYRKIAVKRLDRGLDGVAVTKAFVPGLGSLSRTRRAAR